MTKGYAVHHIESPEGSNLLALHNLTPADIQEAVVRYDRKEKSHIRTVLGLGSDGLIGSERENWNPGLPDAFAETFIIVPWVQIFALLGRVPEDAIGALFGDTPKTKQ